MTKARYSLLQPEKHTVGRCGKLLACAAALTVAVPGTYFLIPRPDDGTPLSSEIPGLDCVNPVVKTGELADPIIPEGFELVQAHLQMRHLDRWIYDHPLISDRCWSNQLNSSNPTMAAQCRYNLSSPWEAFSFSGDPYSTPLPGNCNTKQLTRNGLAHARTIGSVLKTMFPDRLAACPRGAISLETFNAQKNQLTTAMVYQGLCGKLPSPTEFPKAAVLSDGVVAAGRPFFIETGVCASQALEELTAEAKAAMYSSSYFADVQSTAGKVGEATGHTGLADDQLTTLLDNELDCVWCHYCHGLDDVPRAFYQDTLFSTADTLETMSRTWPYDYWRQTSTTDYVRFVQNNYGYYFYVLLDRIERVLAQGTQASEPLLFIQVTSDSTLTPMLVSMDMAAYARRRPIFGSTILFQVLKNSASGGVFIRVAFNGETLPVCGSELCPLDEFRSFVKSVTPTRADCSRFFNAYKG